MKFLLFIAFTAVTLVQVNCLTQTVVFYGIEVRRLKFLRSTAILKDTKTTMVHTTHTTIDRTVNVTEATIMVLHQQTIVLSHHQSQNLK